MFFGVGTVVVALQSTLNAYIFGCCNYYHPVAQPIQPALKQNGGFYKTKPHCALRIVHCALEFFPPFQIKSHGGVDDGIQFLQ